jgi:hypothetical protein
LTKPLTDKQRFALRAVELGAVRAVAKRVGWKTVAEFWAWDSNVTVQIRSLVRTHRLCRYTRDGVVMR